MEKQEEFRELIRFASVSESEFFTALLSSGEVAFKLSRLPEQINSPGHRVHNAVVIRVLKGDLKRAEMLLDGYRKTQGVPFS